MLPRKDVGEHLAILVLYPDIKHVYVEGRSDARYLEMAASMPKNCDVHAVDDVDVPLEDDEPNPFLSGNRFKVVELARAFDGKLRANNAKCLVDKDHEHEHPVLPVNGVLVLTDFANTFVGEIKFEWVRDSVFVTFGARLTDEFWTRLLSACRFAFAYRLVRNRDFSRAHMPSLANFVELADGLPYLNQDSFCENAVTSPHIDLSGSDLLSEVRVALDAQEGDARHFINSEDFLVLLHIFIRQMRLATNVSREALRNALLVASPRPSVDQPRLQLLVDWMTD